MTAFFFGMGQAHYIIRNLAGYIAARAVRLCLTGHRGRRRCGSCGGCGLLGWRCFYLRRRLRGWLECWLRYGLRHCLLDRLWNGLSLRLRNGWSCGRCCALDSILRGRGRLGNRPCDGLRCRLSYWLAGRLVHGRNRSRRCWRCDRSRSRNIAGD